MFPGLQPGVRTERQHVVTAAMVTRHAGGPGVLTTPHMIGLMEDAAHEAAGAHLPADHTTVGYDVAIRHRAPTPLGMRVTVRAELVEVAGRRLRFRVEAWNEKELIGKGTHRRTIVRIGALDDRR